VRTEVAHDATKPALGIFTLSGEAKTSGVAGPERLLATYIGA